MSKRTFEVSPPTRGQVPLIVGITGPSHSGKTYSALELATGMQEVVGGVVAGADTEAGRMEHYKDFFKFQHVPFEPPYGPHDYMDAIDFCVNELKAGIIVLDNMTHEHDGEGGVMDQSERFLAEKCKDDWKCREKNLMLSLVRPKVQRKELNRYIRSLGKVIFILCYRAAEKIKPQAGKEPLKLGWQPITTSDLPYDMTARFLLGPGSEGRPTLNPPEVAEQLAIKLPKQFHGWIKQGDQLNRAFGKRLAQWALGAGASSPAPPPPESERSMVGYFKLLKWTQGQARDWARSEFGVNDYTDILEEDVDQALKMLNELLGKFEVAK